MREQEAENVPLGKTADPQVAMQSLLRHNHEVLSADLNTQTKLEAYEEGKESCNSLRGYKDYLASSSDMIRQKDDSKERDPQAHRKRV